MLKLDIKTKNIFLCDTFKHKILDVIHFSMCNVATYHICLDSMPFLPQYLYKLFSIDKMCRTFHSLQWPSRCSDHIPYHFGLFASFCFLHLFPSPNNFGAERSVFNLSLGKVYSPRFGWGVVFGKFIGLLIFCALKAYFTLISLMRVNPFSTSLHFWTTVEVFLCLRIVL